MMNKLHIVLAGIFLLALVGCGQDEVETTADKVEDSLHNVVEISLFKKIIMSAIVFLIIGVVSGCLAGIVLQGGRLALLGNIIVGIIGSVAGGFLFGTLGLSADVLIGSIMTDAIGGMVLLFGVRVIK